jgi:hypothetical protein
MRRWANINHFRDRVARARQVTNTVHQHGLLTAAEFHTLSLLRFDSPLPGFRPGLVVPTISSLHELLGEKWLGERVIDARIDVLSRDLNAHCPNLIRFFDCYFHTELANSFRNGELSRELRRLQEEILTSPPALIAFLINKEDIHWAPAAVIPALRTVLQGDSAGFGPHEELLVMLRWWLKDVVPEDGDWEERGLPVERQGPGSGSCALASVSAIVSLAHEVDGTLTGRLPSDALPGHFTLWQHENSVLVRRDWLQVLLRTAISGFRGRSVRTLLCIHLVLLLTFMCRYHLSATLTTRVLRSLVLNRNHLSMFHRCFHNCAHLLYHQLPRQMQTLPVHALRSQVGLILLTCQQSRHLKAAHQAKRQMHH